MSAVLFHQNAAYIFLFFWLQTVNRVETNAEFDLIKTNKDVLRLHPLHTSYLFISLF